MKIRLKFLIFLGAFLSGAFLIVSWKSYSVFSQKYKEMAQQKESESLDQMGFYLAQRLRAAQSLFAIENPTVAQLAGNHVRLLAHVINDGGRWKAQWQEGVEGIRSDAQALTKQVPFESLSVVRPSWQFVNYKEREQGAVYIIPGKSEKKMEFYAIFFDPMFFSDALARGASREAYAAISPFAGEIYSTSKDVNLAQYVESHKKHLTKAQTGFLSLDQSKYIAFVFHPDIQLYLLKTASNPMLNIPRGSVFLTMALLALFLLGIALFAQDTLLKSIFSRIDNAVNIMKRAQSGEDVGEPEPVAYDELLELEQISHYQPQVVEVAAAATTPEKAVAKETAASPASKIAAADSSEIKVNDKVRSQVINSLGYVQKMKQEGRPSSYLTLLEGELRDLRRIIDPIQTTFDPFKSTAALPLTPSHVVKTAEEFNLSPRNPDIESFIKEFKSKSTLPITGTSTANESTQAPLEIRKPKRDVNGSKDV
ncbi:MAG: hypothetical protein K2Q26_10660 [Bdellovibrionales bacterium]|nr:hypothetical protein [Bdellovibrionales bacterium]